MARKMNSTHTNKSKPKALIKGWNIQYKNNPKRTENQNTEQINNDVDGNIGHADEERITKLHLGLVDCENKSHDIGPIVNER